MRVLFWTQLFWPYVGGVETLGATFALGMRRRGHRLLVVTSHGSLRLPDAEDYEGIPVRRLPFLQALAERDLELLGQTKRAVAGLKRQFRPDLVHVNLSDPSVMFHLHTAGAHQAPLLVSVRVALPTREAGPDTLLGRTLRTADWVTANSTAILEATRRLVPEITGRSSVIYNGLDRPRVPPSALPTAEPRVLCLGRIVRDKGFDLALDAFPAVLKRFPRAELLVAGDGPARGELEERAAALCVDGAVRFAGWVAPDDVPDLINSATVVVMPSRWEEAFGLVALEAALMARPVVATRVGGLPEVVAEGETGLLVAREDSAALAEAVIALLSQPERAAQMGQTARRRAGRLFSLRRHLDEYDALYHKLKGVG